MKYYIVETCSSFKIKYLVAADEEPKNGRLQHMVDDNMREFSQEFMGEKIVGVEEYTADRLLEKYEDDPNIFGQIFDHANYITDETIKEDE